MNGRKYPKAGREGLRNKEADKHKGFSVGTVTTGASNDIEQATKLARAMITRFGMDDDFGMVAFETVTNQYLGGDTSLSCSAETQSKIDERVVALVKKQYEKAKAILVDNKKKLVKLATYREKPKKLEKQRPKVSRSRDTELSGENKKHL